MFFFYIRNNVRDKVSYRPPPSGIRGLVIQVVLCVFGSYLPLKICHRPRTECRCLSVSCSATLSLSKLPYKGLSLHSTSVLISLLHNGEHIRHRHVLADLRSVLVLRVLLHLSKVSVLGVLLH